MRIAVAAIVWVLAELALMRWADAASVGGEGALQKGISEFRDGAFAQALADFQAAQRAGLDTPVLHYNLGATYYKLNLDPQAEAEFKALLRDPKFAEFSRYNLALIARRAGRQSEALEYFSAVASGQGNANLRALARAQLYPDSQPASRWHGLIELGGGYDDNVTLTERTALVRSSGSSSALGTGYVNGTGRVAGDEGRGLWVNGSLRDTQYFKQSAFDLLVARAGPEYRFSADEWRLRTGASATYIRFGTTTLETLVALDVRAEHRLGNGRIRLDYALARIDGGGGHDYLSGWQNQFGLRMAWQPGPVHVTAGYILTLNQRQDRVIGTEFSSVSPTRNEFEVDLRWTPADDITLYVNGSYWRSRYADPNLFLQAGTLVELRRVDTGRDVELGARYRIGAHARLAASSEYRSNESDITRYSYTSHRYTLRIAYVY